MYVEYRGRWPLKHNGCFIDHCRLVKMDDAPPPPPPPEPLPGVDVAAVRAKLDVIESTVAAIRDLLP